MNFKLLTSAFLLMGTAICASAQDAADIRVYINPGHGSWGPNNRHMATIGHYPISTSDPDTTDFFESNTNLWKCLELFHQLKEYGFQHDAEDARDLDQNLVMSRIKNGPYPYTEVNGVNPDQNNPYNRSLSEIAREVEENYYDMFISVHSNAASEDASSVNYLYFAYFNANGSDESTCIDMATKAWDHRILDRHTQWTNYDYTSDQGNPRIAEQTLGVLRHSVSGYLVEGYFHTYQPARHRAMNRDVCRLEGLDYARGVADYFEIPLEETGEIYGIVRDKFEKFTHDLYHPRTGTDDVYLPLNGVIVTLKQGDNVIDTYTTDVNYNGAFVFMNLVPGTYTLCYEHPDYDCSYTSEVVVEPAKISYHTAFLTNKYYYTGEPGEEINYPNIVSASNATLAESYDLNSSFIDQPVDALQDKEAKRMIWMKDKLYILAFAPDSTATITVHDGTTGKLLADVSTEGCVGTELNLSDIAVTADGILIASAKNKNHKTDASVEEGETRGIANFYRWDNDANGIPTGASITWFSTDYSGNWSRGYVGGTIAYSGTIAKGTFASTSEGSSGSGQIRNITWDIVDGISSEYELIQPAKVYAKDLGVNYRYAISPNDRHNFLLLDMGEKYGIREFQLYHSAATPALLESPETLPKATTGAGFFRFADESLMTFGTPEQPLALYRITDGIDAPTQITLNYPQFEGSTESVLTTGYPIANTDSEGNVTSGDFAIFVLRDGKLSRFTTAEVTGINDIVVDKDQPVVYYDLNGRPVDANNLQQGAYIRIKGTTATKVIIR